MKWVISEKQAGMQLKEFLLNDARFSKRLLIKAKSNKAGLLVNGVPKTVRYILRKDDVLAVILPKEKPAERMKAAYIPLAILFEDEYMIILNKQAGIPVIPSRNQPAGTIANGLLYYYQQINLQATVHTVTRLDKDTSGALLIAKSQYIHSLLSTMQRQNEISRTYGAIVAGQVQPVSGTISAPIGRKENSIIERAVTATGGSNAVSHYRLLQMFKQQSLVEIKLETGRTHQIRVHMAHLGHPLIGDSLYGKASPKIFRQALHCSELAFQHPMTGEAINIKVPLPEDMLRLIHEQDIL